MSEEPFEANALDKMKQGYAGKPLYVKKEEDDSSAQDEDNEEAV